MAIENGEILEYAESKAKLYDRLGPKLDSGQLDEMDPLIRCVLPDDSDETDVAPAFEA